MKLPIKDCNVEYLVTGKKDSAPEHFVHYPAEIRTLADKLSKMSPADRMHVAALINSYEE